MRTIVSIFTGLLFLAVIGCKEAEPLPVLKESVEDFTFVNQNGDSISQADFKGKIYIADFFFTHCPLQCPTMKVQMKRIYDKYEDSDNVVLLSHTIDPKNDTVPALHEYARKLGVTAPKWQFVTGKHLDIYRMAKEYFITVIEEKDEPGGYAHSPQFMLVDGKGRIRGHCNGLEAEEVTVFLTQIDQLLHEK